MCTFFSLLPPGLAALLRSAGFFSGAVFFAGMTLARSVRFSWFSDWIQMVQRSALCRSRREFSHEYFLQNLASTQPRTSLVKLARSPCTDPPGAVAGRSCNTDKAGRGERPAGRAELRALTQAALLAEFQKSSKLHPCGTARQRGRGVFDGAAAWA